MPSESRRRRMHVRHGYLGQLFTDFNNPIAKTKGPGFSICDYDSENSEIYDNVIEEWVPLTTDLYRSIPQTYTFAPQPDHVQMEMEYFIRSAGLLNHSFIWSTISIPRENYLKIRSFTNAAFRGRYTVTPWFPQIDTLGKVEHGFYVINTDGYRIIYR